MTHAVHTERTGARLVVVFLGLVVLLSGCGSVRDALPVGVGSGRDDLKQSPCSCLEIEQQEAPGWREEMERQVRRSLA